MADHNKVLIEELERRLIWYREEASREEFDAEAVDAICTMLQKLSPLEETRRTKEETFEKIMRQIDLEEEESEENGKSDNVDGRLEESGAGKAAGKSSGSADGGEIAEKKEKAGREKRRSFLHWRHGMRAAVIFIAVAGIFFSLDRVTYARENKSLFTMILEKVGWLEIEKEENMKEGVVDGGEALGEFYDSWAELDSEVKRKITVPRYIPEGYSLFGIRCWDSEDRKILQANYYGQENGHLLIEITLWKDNEQHYRENVSDESACELLSEDSDENTLYYEAEDEYICMAFMENSFYRISGSIELEEMIKIREGLGDTLLK